MYSSKIDQLGESTFRHHKIQSPSNLSQLKMGTTLSQPAKQLADQNQLLQYQLRLPQCPYHHQPVLFLCLRTDCKCSTYGLCSMEQCRKLHSDPDADLIELSAFNELVRDNCSSLLLLTSKMGKYLRQIRQNIIHKLDINIERSLHLINKIYLQEVPQLIRLKQHSQISSEKLSRFIKLELAEGGQRRSKMEALKNSISQRISDRQKLVQRLCSSNDYQFLLLNDVVKVQQVSSSEILSRAQFSDFESSIITHREQVDVVLKFMRENRANMFSRISLLFRASQHQFRPQAFHQAVGGKSPTLLLVKTTLGRMFGAYINCKLNDHQEWIADATGLSFIFSIDKEESYRLKTEAQSRLKAAFGGLSGPQLGSGCDLYISEGCHLYRKSGSNLGGSYRLPGFLQFNTAKARSYLAGEQSFQVQEYQIFLFE